MERHSHVSVSTSLQREPARFCLIFRNLPMPGLQPTRCVFISQVVTSNQTGPWRALRLFQPSQFKKQSRIFRPFTGAPKSLFLTLPDLLIVESHRDIPGNKRRRQENGEFVFVKCDEQRATCGLRGKPPYVRPPATSFQMRVRAREDQVMELQHYTRTFNAKVVQR